MKHWFGGLVLIGLLVACVAPGLGGSTPTKALGSASAPIMLEVFSDFQCPGCKVLYDQTLRPLMNDYVRQGKVYLVHREYPLPQHQYAREAACYACAANRVGKYEEVCATLFGSQTKWEKDGKVDEAACAALTPAEAKRVRALAKTPEIAAELQSDMELGRRLNLTGTPSLVLTHQLRQYRIPAGADYNLLRRFLDQLLSR